MKKYIVMGVVVAVLSLGFAFAMNLQKANNAKADQNTPVVSTGCGCQKQSIGTCGCSQGNKCANYIDTNNDGKCDCGGKCGK